MRWTVLLLLLLANAAIDAREMRTAEQPLRFMTYNIRLDLESDGENSWPHRRDSVAAQIERLRPDVFGMQEVLPAQKSDLITALPQYRFVGGGRDGDGKGEASPLAFDPSRFDLLESGLFWLSPTPDKPSKGWDAAYNRVVTWARLRVRGAPQKLLVINTHWDHIGAVARKESALQISRWIAAHAKSCERVLMSGDFNTELASEPLQLLLSSGLRDARGASRTAPLGPMGTFNGFRNPPDDGRAIDHFLVGEGVRVERYLVQSQIIGGRIADGRWPSDHFPVIVDLSIEACRR